MNFFGVIMCIIIYLLDIIRNLLIKIGNKIYKYCMNLLSIELLFCIICYL